MRKAAWFASVVVLLAASAGRAEERKRNPKALGVAFLEFKASGEMAQEWAGWLPDLLVTALAEAEELRLVTRSEVKRIEEEQKLDVAKMLQQKKGQQVVKVLDAQVVVRAKVSMTEEEVRVLASVIGPVTGVEVPIELKQPATGREQLVKELASELRKTLRERKAELLPPPPEVQEVNRTRDIVAALGQVLPRVGVMVLDARAPKDRPPDRTAEASLSDVFPKIGYPVDPVGGTAEREWLARVAEGKGAFPGPPAFPAEVVVVGSAHTEYATRTADDVSYRGRIEVRAYDVRTGNVIGNYAGTSVVAGASDEEARRLSLEDVGRRAALNLGVAIATARKNS